MKDAAEECRHKITKWRDERHCNSKDTQFSVYGMDEPGDVVQAAGLNCDAQHPEHLLRIGTEDKSLIKAESHQPRPGLKWTQWHQLIGKGKGGIDVCVRLQMGVFLTLFNVLLSYLQRIQ